MKGLKLIYFLLLLHVAQFTIKVGMFGFKVVYLKGM